MANEEAVLDEINQRPLFGRMLGYMKFTGPGYLQSALTLGGETRTSWTQRGLGLELHTSALATDRFCAALVPAIRAMNAPIAATLHREEP